jgi:methionyl-tRNA formyltransferase
MSQDTPKKTRIALFANHAPGLDVAHYLNECRDQNEVAALYLPGENPEHDSQIAAALLLEKQQIFSGPDIIKQPEHVEWFQAQKFDFIICVYWPWLLKGEIFKSVGSTLNFHPALLPINRGWFPHVHSLMDGSKTGVTLHRIEDGADTGAIWAQQEIPIQPTDTAKEIYERLQHEIVSLFKAQWNDIRAQRLDAKPQDESQANYHAKKEIEALDRIDLDQPYKARDLINKMRARSFGQRGFAFYEDHGEKVFVKISLSKTSKFP